MGSPLYDETPDDMSGNFLLMRPDSELFIVSQRGGVDGKYAFTEEGAEWFRENINGRYHITQMDQFLAVYFTNDMDFIHAKLRWESKSFDQLTDL